jgi:hypothetical protein
MLGRTKPKHLRKFSLGVWNLRKFYKLEPQTSHKARFEEGSGHGSNSDWRATDERNENARWAFEW